MPLYNSVVYNRRAYNQTVVAATSSSHTLTVNVTGTTTITVSIADASSTTTTVTYMKYRLYNRATYNGTKLATSTVVVPRAPTYNSLGQLFNSRVYNGLISVYVPPVIRSYLNGGYNSDPYNADRYNEALNVIEYFTISPLNVTGTTTITVSVNILRPHYYVYNIKFVMPEDYTIKMVAN